MTLDGRRAAVTGAAGGIGSACVRALLDAGAEVIGIDSDAKSLQALSTRTGCTTQVLDLSDLGQLATLDLDCDILVNNAGIQHVSPVVDFPLEQFDAMARLMLVAPFALARSALPGMYARGWGRIVNISSVHGLRASANKSAYVAAKHGLEGLSKTIALEGAGSGVTSNTICPGYVRTPLVDNQIAAQATVHDIPEEQVVQDVFLRRSAVKRLIEPAEVADAVVYLCSPAASFITGSSLVLDGGWTAS